MPVKCDGANEFRVSGSTSSWRRGDFSGVASERAVNLFSDSDALTCFPESLDCCYQSAARVEGAEGRVPSLSSIVELLDGLEHVRLHGWIYDVLLRYICTLFVGVFSSLTGKIFLS